MTGTPGTSASTSENSENVVVDQTNTAPPTEPPPRLLTVGRRVLPALLGLAMLELLVQRAAHPLGNTDTYFHLRFGHEFLTDWSLRDPGSVSIFATNDWVPTQWLSQVVMAQTEAWFGLSGVAWLSGLLMISFAVVIYFGCRRWADPLPSVAIMILALIATSYGLNMRPQLLSYIFLSIVAVSWLRCEGNERTPWWLVPLTWLWAMCHGMWIVGVVISVVGWFGLALDSGFAEKVSLRRLAVPLGSLAAAACTPIGPGLLNGVAEVGSRGRFFSEWATPSFTAIYSVAFLLMFALAVVAMLRRTQTPWLRVCFLGLGLVFAVYSTRTLPAASLLVAPLAARELQSTLGQRQEVQIRERYGILTAMALSLGVLALLVPHTSAEPYDHPRWLDAQMQQLPPGTPVISDWGEGGYLLWRYPDLDVVMHGYGDIFTTPELERNKTITDVDAGWIEDLQSTGATTAVLPPGSTLDYALRSNGWRVVKESDALRMLTAPDDWASRVAVSRD